MERIVNVFLAKIFLDRWYVFSLADVLNWSNSPVCLGCSNWKYRVV